MRAAVRRGARRTWRAQGRSLDYTLLYAADVKLQPLLHGAAGVTNVPRCATQRAWAAACVRGLARGTPAEVLVVGARERAVVVEDDTVSDHFAVPPVPHPVVRQGDVPGYLGLQPGDAMMQP